MAYEFLDRAREAISRGDYNSARAEMFGPNECNWSALTAPDVPSLRQWAQAEQDQGYGLRAEILEWVADELLSAA